MAEQPNKKTSLSAPIGVFYNHAANNEQVKLSVWNGRIFCEFLRFSKDGGNSRPESLKFTFYLDQFSVINSVISQILMERVKQFSLKEQYREYPKITFNSVFNDQDGTLKTAGRLSISTAVVNGKNRFILSGTNDSLSFDIVFGSKITKEFLDPASPFIKSNCDLDDMSFYWFAKALNDALVNIFSYNVANSLKDSLLRGSGGGEGGDSGSSSGGSSSGSGRRHAPNRNSEDDIPF